MSNGDHARRQGEHRGDFTRDTFDPAKHFSRVLMQQGRVQLDADWNEQTSILLHYLRCLAADLIGPHGGPGNGFVVGPSTTVAEGKLVFSLTEGRYYVDGILCEAEPDRELVVDASELTEGNFYLAFLDVWERHVAAIEDPDIPEVALGGPDTATRAQVTYRILVPPVEGQDQTDLAAFAADPKADAVVATIQAGFTPTAVGRLRARAKIEAVTEACHISPESQYRGPENQLYRVEIHRPGTAWDGQMDKKKPAGNAADAATFKWSRDNSSVIFPILGLKGDSVQLTTLGRDGRRSLKQGDWVEIMDDDHALRAEVGELRQIKDVDADEMTVTLSDPATKTYDDTSTTHPLLRRWDQSSSGGELAENALLLTEGSGEDEVNWITLEDGVQIQFPTPMAEGEEEPPPNSYRAGDYWLIPARVATGDVLWPKMNEGDEQVAEPLPPHGVEHHYAPLGLIRIGADDSFSVERDLRHSLAK